MIYEKQILAMYVKYLKPKLVLRIPYMSYSTFRTKMVVQIAGEKAKQYLLYHDPE